MATKILADFLKKNLKWKINDTLLWYLCVIYLELIIFIDKR